MTQGFKDLKQAYNFSNVNYFMRFLDEELQDYDEEVTDEQITEYEEKLGKFTLLFQTHNLGDGSYQERVYKSEKFDCMIRMCGYYSSYRESEWDDDIEEVFPRNIIVTIYENAEDLAKPRLDQA